jgi:hypothetical protein
VLEKRTYVALGGFAVDMLARITRCREADVGGRTARDRKIELPQTIGQGIALCNASALFWRKLDLTSLGDWQELRLRLPYSAYASLRPSSPGVLATNK